uniref:Signal transduction histidine kinase, LytS n=1 Tax=Sphingobacterium sp. (strain 21) TaxID=743722 RepID=F4C9Y3_SPHS2
MLFWILLYVFYGTLNKDLFQVAFFSLLNTQYTVIMVLAIATNHYFIFGVTEKLFDRRKWMSGIMSILLIYMFSALCVTLSLKYFAYGYPMNPGLQKLYHRYHIEKNMDIFSYKILVLVFVEVVVYNFLTFWLKFGLDNYETKMAQKALLLEKNNMELSFLRSQIQPHFLFNTLNNIYGQVVENEQASQSILKLSDLLRFSLYESNRKLITLGEEIKFLNDYINLERLRHREGKVNIYTNFEKIDRLDCEISPLILVNFVENAFKHGVNSSIAFSWVKIILKEEKKVVTFIVSNSVGNTLKNKRTGGLGLSNVRRRLELEYPERYDLSIKETQETYEVVLTLKPKSL